MITDLLRLACEDNGEAWAELRERLNSANTTILQEVRGFAAAHQLAAHDHAGVEAAVRTLLDQTLDEYCRARLGRVRDVIDTGIVATYCRPYTRTQGDVPRLDTPPWLTYQQHALHERLIELRDKVHGHTDFPHPDGPEILTAQQARERMIASAALEDQDAYRAALEANSPTIRWHPDDTSVLRPVLTDEDLRSLGDLASRSSLRHQAVSFALNGKPYPFSST